MYSHTNKVKDTGCRRIVDLWEPYRGKYPEPTRQEFNLIKPFLYKFAWEDGDFDESDPDWISLKNRLQSPNLRHLLIKFVRQVRGTKGYDVDLCFDFIVHPYTVFVPRSLVDKESHDEAMAATAFAIGEINSLMMSVGKNYKLVSVDKLVSATKKTVEAEVVDDRPIVTVIILNMLLLTFTAKEITISADNDVMLLTYTAKEKEKEDEDVVSFQAMVRVYDQPPYTFQLKEWKFKPILI